METEKRLIDAIKVADKVSAIHFYITGLRNGKVLLNKYMEDYRCEVLRILSEAPTVDAVEVVHGRWIDRYGGKYAIPAYDCSECKKSAPLMHDMDMLGNWKARQFFANYCPNCGAKMDGDGDG